MNDPVKIIGLYIDLNVILLSTIIIPSSLNIIISNINKVNLFLLCLLYLYLLLFLVL